MAGETRSSEKFKVTDKRLFTAEGEVRVEYHGEIQPRDPAAEPPPPREEPAPKANAAPPPEERKPRGTPREKGENPGTPFTLFVESLIVNAYFLLGLLRSPEDPGGKPDPDAAKQMIDIIGMLEEKTRGNLTDDETEFLDAHLGELKLAWVRMSRSL